MSRLLCTLALVLTTPALAGAQIVVTLKNKFIEDNKHRATIEATFTVDKAHKNPNPPSKDADLHVAGRAPEIQLPIVAELMNAADDKIALDLIHAAETTGTPVAVSGAWRLWCEHGGTSDQIQGQPLTKFTTTNPDHCFELHPITRVENQATAATFHPIAPGFKTKDAFTAFTAYEAVNSELVFNAQKQTTTINTQGIGFNYVEFIIELNENPTLTTVDGGLMIMAAVQDLDGELLVRNRRMVFAPDTAPLKAVMGKTKCGRLHVLGIPQDQPIAGVLAHTESHVASRGNALESAVRDDHRGCLRRRSRSARGLRR